MNYSVIGINGKTFPNFTTNVFHTEKDDGEFERDIHIPELKFNGSPEDLLREWGLTISLNSKESVLNEELFNEELFDQKQMSFDKDTQHHHEALANISPDFVGSQEVYQLEKFKIKF